MINWKGMRWAGHVACQGNNRNAYSFGGKARRKETPMKM
jgi:hypothetical protein